MPFRSETHLCTSTNNVPPSHDAHQQVKQGVYAYYSTGQDSSWIGQSMGVNSDYFPVIKAYCDATPACIGMQGTGDNTPRSPFSGVKWADAVGKVRVVGETLTSSMSTPPSMQGKRL